jgi:hypothetical protein
MMMINEQEEIVRIGRESDKWCRRALTCMTTCRPALAPRLALIVRSVNQRGVGDQLAGQARHMRPRPHPSLVLRSGAEPTTATNGTRQGCRVVAQAQGTRARSRRALTCTAFCFWFASSQGASVTTSPSSFFSWFCAKGHRSRHHADTGEAPTGGRDRGRDLTGAAGGAR